MYIILYNIVIIYRYNMRVAYPATDGRVSASHIILSIYTYVRVMHNSNPPDEPAGGVKLYYVF